MRSPRLLEGSFGIPTLVLGVVMSCSLSACGGTKESGDTSIVVEVARDEITLENKTGTSLARGEITLTATGIPRPYTANIAYLSSGAKRSFPFSQFRMSDGSPFRKELAKGKSVKVKAQDSSGKTYEREVPFN